MSTSGADSWIGQQLAGGRYEVIQKLGQGGMGSVYLTTDVTLETQVVIKAPHRAMVADEEFTERFSRYFGAG